MNAAGAKRWMHHMGKTLREFDPVLRAVDPRIPPCIVGFLRTKMETYASDFGWRFQESDFDFASGKDPDVALTAALGGKDGDEAATAVVPVYGRRELQSLSVKSLRQLCHNLGVDISTCVEKTEIVSAVAGSGLASVVETPCLTLEGLQEMRVGALKQMARCIGVDISACVEKKEIVRTVAESGAVRVIASGEEEVEGKK